jgi:outer membrane autotransporter protein
MRLPHDWELDGFAAIGLTQYKQRRSVHGERYDTDYSGLQFGAGLSLGRTFDLGANVAARPFASYEYSGLHVDGYDEGNAGLFGLRVGKSRSGLHRVEAGTALSRTFGNGFVEGRVFYSGLYGGGKPGANVAFTRDPSGYSMRSRGYSQDEHAAGMGINAGLRLSESARLSGGYSFTVGEKTASHQGEMTLSVSF